MKIIRNLNIHNQQFRAITDDTRVFLDDRFAFSEGLDAIPKSDILLLSCKQNRHFITQAFLENTKAKIIESSDLWQVLIEECCIQQNAKIPYIIGITGTNGKTTISYMIDSVLRDLGFSSALLGTSGMFINGIQKKPKGLTTPSILEVYDDLLLAISSHCAFFTMEVSSHAIVQERIAGLKFSLKILSNITSDHLDYHKDINEYRQVKNAFFADSVSKKLINADEANAHCDDKRAIYYGIEHNAHFRARDYDLVRGLKAEIKFRRDSKYEEATLNSTLFGKHNFYNALAAIGALKIITHKSLNEIIKSLEHFSGVKGRMEVISKNPLVIVDFAHTEDGMKQIFESFSGYEISVVFGAGGDRDRSKRAKMGACASKYAKSLYITSDNPRTESPQSIIDEILSGVKIDKSQRLYHCVSREEAIQTALKELPSDAVLLILGKGDEDYQIIGTEKIHFSDKEIVQTCLGQGK